MANLKGTTATKNMSCMVRVCGVCYLFGQYSCGTQAPTAELKGEQEHKMMHRHHYLIAMLSDK